MDTQDSAARAALLIERISRLLRARDGETGLNPAQWDALRYISRANRFSRSPTAVSEYLAATKGTVSQTLIALEAKGLLHKHASERDGRGARLEVTEAGWDMLESADPLEHLAIALGDLPPLHASLIAQALSRVLDALLETNGRRAFGSCPACRHFRRDAGIERKDSPHFCASMAVPLSDADVALLCARYEAI